MYQVNVSEAQQRFPELLNAVLGGGNGLHYPRE